MAASKKSKKSQPTSKAATKKPAKKPAAHKPAAKSAAAKPSAQKTAAKKPGAPKAAEKKPGPQKAAATKPPSGTPTDATSPLRGVPLVEQALAQITNPSPMSPKELDKLTLEGRPLTPALRRWLEVDDLMLGEPQSFNEMLAAEFGEEVVDLFEEVAAVLTEPVVLLERGSDSRRFIYLGKTDSHGELPVFTVDTDDTPFVCLNGPLDVWLAKQSEESYYGQLPPEYEPARTEQAKLNFNGKVEFAENQFNKKLTGG